MIEGSRIAKHCNVHLNRDGCVFFHGDRVLARFEWSELDGVSSEHEKWRVHLSSGESIIIMRMRHHLERAAGQDLARCLAGRSEWFTESREVTRKPPSEQRIRFWMIASLVVIVAFILSLLGSFLGIPGLGSFRLERMPLFMGIGFSIYMLALIVFMRALNQLQVRRNRHLWDSKVIPPPESLVEFIKVIRHRSG